MHSFPHGLFELLPSLSVKERENFQEHLVSFDSRDL